MTTRFELPVGNGEKIIVIVPKNVKRWDILKTIKFLKFVWKISKGI